MKTCPEWCIDKDHDAAGPCDLFHVAAPLTLPLRADDPMTYAGNPDFEAPVQLMVDLSLNVDDHPEARVCLRDTTDQWFRNLTLDEAELFAAQILEMTRAARTNTPIVSDELTS